MDKVWQMIIPLIGKIGQKKKLAYLKKKNNVNKLYYEKLFNNYDIGNEEHTLELFEDILENLVSVYMIETLLERKKAVDNLLSSV